MKLQTKYEWISVLQASKTAAYQHKDVGVQTVHVCFPSLQAEKSRAQRTGWTIHKTQTRTGPEFLKEQSITCTLAPVHFLQRPGTNCRCAYEHGRLVQHGTKDTSPLRWLSTNCIGMPRRCNDSFGALEIVSVIIIIIIIIIKAGHH